MLYICAYIFILPLYLHNSYYYQLNNSCKSAIFIIQRITKVITAENHEFFATWRASLGYVKFKMTNDSSINKAMNNTRIVGYYGDYYWKNTTGYDVTLKITVKNWKDDLDSSSSSSAIVYCGATKTVANCSQVVKVTGSTSWSTKTVTYTVPNGYYLILFNCNNADTYYTVCEK